MLSDELKKTIQSNYSRLLESKELQTRPGQKRMIAEIAKSLSSVEMDEEGKRSSAEPAICVVEAGTGTGKTLAYLLSALPVAKALDKKLIIATATVALQEQVIFKDLPDLQRHSDLQFTFALAKGRGRYLCLSRLDNILRANSSQDAMLDLYGLSLEDPGELDQGLYQKMLDKLSDGSWKGDRDDWPDVLEDTRWRNIAVEPGQCSGNRCSNFSNCCFYKSRENLQSVDCIVANHDLVLSDLSLGGGVILPHPSDSIYIFDEAHHLPVKGITHFSHFLRLRNTGKWLEQLTTVFSRIIADTSVKGKLTADVTDAADLSLELRASLNESFAVFEQFSDRAESANARGDITQYVFPLGLVEEELQEILSKLYLEFSEFSMKLENITENLKQCMEADSGELDRQQAENWYPIFGSTLNRSQSAAMLCFNFSKNDEEGEAPCARWINFSEQGGDQEVSLTTSPVLAASALEESLWADCFAAILTSATLTALGNFEFLRMRCGLHDGTSYHLISSPFDYYEAATLKIPANDFDPSDTQAHTQSIIEYLPEVLDGKKGALVLFSSRRQLQEVLMGLETGFRQLVLSQDDFSKQEIIRIHKETVDNGQTSIIFGLASMAEGIDLPGEYCEHVVIAKIPFPVPNAPVDATLGEWVKEQGKNPFIEISVPEAAMRLIQASGRLLRRESDTGTITILDKRLISRRYGSDILNSLPPYRQERF